MFRLSRVLALGALLASACAVQAQSASTTVMTFGYGLNEDSNQGRAARVFAEQVETQSRGRIKVKLAGAAALGSDEHMQQALVAGTQEMMVGSTATLVGTVKEMALWDTPFLFSNAHEADLMLDGPIGDRIREKLKEKGMVGVVYWENGFRNLTNSKRPITKMEDLDGVKLRVMQNNVFLDSFRTLGANAVPMPFSDLFGALQSSAVDGQENPYNTILSSRFYEVQKYLTVTNHVYSPWIVLASRKWWDKLSREDQTVIVNAARASRDYERRDTREEAERAMTQLKAKGMRINELPFAEATRMRNRLTRVYAQIGSSVGMDLWIESQNELMKIRSGADRKAARPQRAL